MAGPGNECCVQAKKKVQCWIVHLAERCSVRTRRALRVAPPLPTWQFFIMNDNECVFDDDFELFIMINYQLWVAHWHRGHPRLDRIIDKKSLTPSPGSATTSTSAESPICKQTLLNIKYDRELFHFNMCCSNICIYLYASTLLYPSLKIVVQHLLYVSLKV